MKKLDQIFIRACKTSEPYTRVNSVYRRFYYGTPDKSTVPCMVSILARICDEAKLCTIEELMRKLLEVDPIQMATGEDDLTPISEKCLRLLVSEIRFTAASEFKGLTSPCRFRN